MNYPQASYQTPNINLAPILSNLNDKQQQAIIHRGSPLLIMAVAGSGKTRALTTRIAYFLATGEAAPNQILAITFTNKAANEMKSRITNMLGNSNINTQNMQISTFHSMCARILRENSQLLDITNFTIIDTDDQRTIIKEVLNSIDEKLGSDKKVVKEVLDEISTLKNQLITPKDTTSETDSLIVEAYKKYQESLKSSNYLDFDDLLIKTEFLFAEFDDVLAWYQYKWQHIFIDEYQDTNLAQFKIIDHLVKNNPSKLTIVGDHSQSIYGFRGADIKNIQNFLVNYPTGTVIIMDQNYRSYEPILSLANQVIATGEKLNIGQRQLPMATMWTDRTGGNKPKLVLTKDTDEEVAWGTSEIQKLIQNGTPLDQIAILYRINATSYVFEKALIELDIPYKLIGGVSFAARAEVKDALSMLRVIHNHKDNISLMRAIGAFSVGVGKVTVNKVLMQAITNNTTLYDVLTNENSIDRIPCSLPTKTKLKAFGKLLLSTEIKIQYNGLGDALLYLLNESGYLPNLTEVAEKGDEKAMTRLGNIEQLYDIANEQDLLVNDHKITITEALDQLLATLTLEEDVKQNADNTKPTVSLMTVHRAKGLEFDAVFVVDFTSGSFPFVLSKTPAELAEERRLVYVAITRAAKHLYLTAAQKKLVWGKWQETELSPYVAEVPDELLDLVNPASSAKTPRRKPVGYSKPPDTKPATKLPSWYTEIMKE